VLSDLLRVPWAGISHCALFVDRFALTYWAVARQLWLFESRDPLARENSPGR